MLELDAAVKREVDLVGVERPALERAPGERARENVSFAVFGWQSPLTVRFAFGNVVRWRT